MCCVAIPMKMNMSSRPRIRDEEITTINTFRVESPSSSRILNQSERSNSLISDSLNFRKVNSWWTFWRLALKAFKTSTRGFISDAVGVSGELVNESRTVFTTLCIFSFWFAIEMFRKGTSCSSTSSTTSCCQLMRLFFTLLRLVKKTTIPVAYGIARAGLTTTPTDEEVKWKNIE